MGVFDFNAHPGASRIPRHLFDIVRDEARKVSVDLFRIELEIGLGREARDRKHLAVQERHLLDGLEHRLSRNHLLASRIGKQVFYLLGDVDRVDRNLMVQVEDRRRVQAYSGFEEVSARRSVSASALASLGSRLRGFEARSVAASAAGARGRRLRAPPPLIS